MRAKILAPKPDPGPLSKRIAGAVDWREERCRIALESGIPEPFNYLGIDIVVLKMGRFESSKPYPTPPGVEFWVEAYWDGKKLPIDGHLPFFPPPVMVQSGTYRIEAIDGKDVEIANHREDPRAALMEVIGQTIAGQLK